MDIEDRRAMLRYLPEYTRVAQTPTLVACWETNKTPPKIVMEDIELKTSDIVSAFLYLQQAALENAHKERDKMLRERAIARIRQMTYFKDPLNYERRKALILR